MGGLAGRDKHVAALAGVALAHLQLDVPARALGPWRVLILDASGEVLTDPGAGVGSTLPTCQLWTTALMKSFPRRSFGTPLSAFPARERGRRAVDGLPLLKGVSLFPLPTPPETSAPPRPPRWEAAVSGSSQSES